MTTLLFIMCFAGAASALMTRAMRDWSVRIGLVDRPDGYRKMHERVIPLGGGVAVFVASMATLLIAMGFPFPTDPIRELQTRMGDFYGLFWASVVLCAVGLIDDYRAISGKAKLAGQIIAALIVVAFGLKIQMVQVFSWEVQLGVLAIPFTVIWLLGAINSLNLIDGIDGLASTVGIILSVMLGLMALWTGHRAEAVVAFVLVGALVGFLRYNFPPATIFLGDTGSMLIGLVAGTLAMLSCIKGPATVALAAPLAIWAIPFFDSTTAILRRKLTGRSIYATDRGHLHHMFLRSGFTHKETLMYIGLLCVITGAGALVSVHTRNEMFAALAAVAVISTMIATRIFGYAEFLLLMNYLMRTGVSLVRVNGARTGVRRQSVRLQGTREWEALWDMLTQSAERLQLSSVRLDVNLPSLHEGYHASWERVHHHADARDLWKADVPLAAGKHVVGRLMVTGQRSDGSLGGWMVSLNDLLEGIEDQLVAIVQNEPFVRAPKKAEAG